MKTTFSFKAVPSGTSKADIGAGADSFAETFWKSEQELEPKPIVSALQHWLERLHNIELSQFSSAMPFKRPLIIANAMQEDIIQLLLKSTTWSARQQ
jgi:hypothetical protein